MFLFGFKDVANYDANRVMSSFTENIFINSDDLFSVINSKRIVYNFNYEKCKDNLKKFRDFFDSLLENSNCDLVIYFYTVDGVRIGESYEDIYIQK